MPKRKPPKPFDETLQPLLTREAYNQAVALKESAELLAREGRYGHASALLVLSIQELGKAFQYRLSFDFTKFDVAEEGERFDQDAEFLDVKRTVSVSFTEDHKKKTELVLMLGWLIGHPWDARNDPVFRSFVNELYRKTKGAIEYGKTIQPIVEGTDLKIPPDASHPEYAPLLEFLISTFMRVEATTEALEELRITGFYVDLVDRKVRSPAMVTKTTYESLKAYVDAMLTAGERVVTDGFPEWFTRLMWEHSERTTQTEEAPRPTESSHDQAVARDPDT